MKKIYTFVFSLVLSFLSSALSAQAVSLPYQMNFEANESAELANWVLNPGATAEMKTRDRWVVGSSVHSAGRQALYISVNGQDARFDTIPNVQFAFRQILLPLGQYDLSFDWMCEGSDVSSLYVGFTDFSGVIFQARDLVGALTQVVRARMLSSFSGLNGVNTWQNASLKVQSDGVTVQTLVFAWVSNNTTASTNISACIDNIVITNANCKRPTDIVAVVESCDTVRVSWTGTSSKYEFEHRAAGASSWVTKRDIPANGTQGTVVLTNMSEGSYDFRVRGICSPDTSAWTYLSGFVVFCPETHCVNFTDLTAPTVTCTYGTTTYTSGYYNDPNNRNHAYDHVGVIDFGPDQIESRHTVNWDKTATDPRTGGRLPLIPSGGYASVRLGNWEYGNGAESITYDYVVDETSAVLLLQYAVVLEYPTGHDDEEMPRFVLEILDENGNLLDPTCGVRNFFAKEADGVNWFSYNPSSSSYSSYYDQVVYKPWTTVGLNLLQLGINEGDHIKVRLTTYDCFLSGHYGYAYFTLDCAKATIETASCAKDASMVMTLVAPEGFNYQWYDEHDNALVGETTRTYLPKDDHTYRCKLTSTEESSCYFYLESRCYPRIPMPDFIPTYAAADCHNRMEMVNTSFVRVYQPDGMVDLAEACDSYYWETWGTTASGEIFQLQTSDHVSPVFDYPEEGGDFFVKLTAYLSGTCVEDTMISIHVDPIQSYDIEKDTVLCRPLNQPTFRLELDGVVISESGKYPITYKTRQGCDSIITWNVTINQSIQIQLDDTVLCYGDSIGHEGVFIGPNSGPLYTSGMWIWNHMSTVSGCDSVVMQMVDLKAPIEPQITCKGTSLDMPFHRVDLEPGETMVNLSLSGSGYDRYTISYIGGNGQYVEEQHPASDHTINNLAINEYIFSFRNNGGCEFIDTVLVGGDTVCVDEILPSAQIQCDCGTAVLWIPYEKCRPYNKARIDHASIKFAAADVVAQGFKDTVFYGLHEKDTIRIPVPKGAEPGTYDIDVIFDTIIGGAIWGQNAFHTSITLTYDSSVIFHRWNENAIISLKNGKTAKKADGSDYQGYEFTEFQWLRNGEEIPGATDSYMEQSGKLVMSDRFRLRLLRADGSRFTTCAYVPGTATPAQKMRIEGIDNVVLTPTAPAAGSDMQLMLSDDAHVEIYSLMGNILLSQDYPTGMHSIAAPSVAGVYIMTIWTQGERLTLHVQVH